MKRKIGWKFLLKTGDKIVSQRDKSEWTLNEWRTVPAPREECKGLNCSLLISDALGYVQGSILAKVEYSGKVIKSTDKFTCEKMRILKTWTWTKEMSVRMAIHSAELSLPSFEKIYPDDKRPRLAIEAAKEWLKHPADRAARAADSAYSAAARAAARAAHAARAAYSAARAAYSAAASAAHAADSAAARAAHAADAADSAAYSAAASTAARKKQIHKFILKMLVEKVRLE